MSIPSGVITLEQSAKVQNSPRLTRIVESLYKFQSVLPMIPMMAKKVSRMDGARLVGNLPSPSFRAINEAPTYVQANPEHFSEQFHIIRDFVGADRIYREDELNFTDPVDMTKDAYMAALAYKINDYFINSTSSTESGKSFVGLKARLYNPVQYGVFNVSGVAETKFSAAANCALGSLSTAEASKFIFGFRQMLTRMGSKTGKNIHAFMDEKLYDLFVIILGYLNQGTSLSVDRDGFDREIMKFQDCQLHPIGRTADQTTRIIPITEDANGNTGGTNYTSVYFVRLEEGYFDGWKWGDPGFRKMPYLDDGTIAPELFEFIFGVRMVNNRSIGRLFGIQV
jgi:hypothetical protein